MLQSRRLDWRRVPHKAEYPTEYISLTKGERSLLFRVLAKSAEHTSGCNYDMVACWQKRNLHRYGANRVDRKASTMAKEYPEPCGTHAELTLTNRYKLNGGTMYIAGIAARSGRPIANTAPCRFCLDRIYDAGVRFVVCFMDMEPVKFSVRHMKECQ